MPINVKIKGAKKKHLLVDKCGKIDCPIHGLKQDAKVLNDEADPAKAAIDAQKQKVERERETLKKQKAQYDIRKAQKALATINTESMSARKSKNNEKLGYGQKHTKAALLDFQKDAVVVSKLD